MSVMIGNNLGDITNLANDYLPKSAIDKSTYKLGEILKTRHLVSNHTIDESSNGEHLKNDAELFVGEVEE